MMYANNKLASGGNPDASFKSLTSTHYKAASKKIKPVFPVRANPLFCSFDRLVVDHINKVGFCYFVKKSDYHAYDLSFALEKEVWIFYFLPQYREISIKFGYALLRHGAAKVQIIMFPVGGANHAA